MRPVRARMSLTARVLEIVRHEARGVLVVGVQDRLGAAVAGDQLAAAEDRLRGGLELEIGQPDEGAVQQRQPVEHQAAGDDGA